MIQDKDEALIKQFSFMLFFSAERKFSLQGMEILKNGSIDGRKASAFYKIEKEKSNFMSSNKSANLQ